MDFNSNVCSRFKLLFVMTFMSLYITGCGSGGAPIPLLSPSGNSSSPGSNGGNTGGGGNLNGGGCPTGTAPTSTGGCISVKSEFTATISYKQTFEGLASDANAIFMLLYQNNGGVNYWQIEKNAITSGGWSLLCSILDDGKFSGGLAYDGTYFYITTYNSSTATTGVRRFYASNCTEASPVNFGYLTNTDTNNKMLASDGASLLYFPSVQFSGNCNYEASFNSSTGALVNSAFNVSFSEQYGNWGIPDGISVRGSTLWAILPDSGGGNPLFWKINTNGTPVGWSNLSATGNSYLTEFSALTVQSSSTAVTMGLISSTQLIFFVLNISEF